MEHVIREFLDRVPALVRLVHHVVMVPTQEDDVVGVVLLGRCPCATLDVSVIALWIAAISNPASMPVRIGWRWAALDPAQTSERQRVSHGNSKSRAFWHSERSHAVACDNLDTEG
jgi:hypothetical protein